MGDLLVGIDIGTSKVRVVVGRMGKPNSIDIIEKKMVESDGVKKGIIVDVDCTAQAIKECLNSIESSADIKINSAYISISGIHVDVVHNTSTLTIKNTDHEITKEDVDRILYQVENIKIPENRQIIDVIPVYFSIDGYDEILDPIGMVGVNLQVHADIVVGRITSVKNIIKSVERAGIKVDGLITEAYATGELLLTPEEMENGAVLIDVGGGITDVSVFKDNRIVFYGSVPVGGNHITNDISLGLRIAYQEAEKIKRKYELALTSLINNDQELTVYDTGQNNEKSIMVSEVVEIIEARVFEILSLCYNLIRNSDFQDFDDSDIILTGGGISYIEGNTELAENIFNRPARVASYRTTENLKPEFYVAAGIIKYVSGSIKDDKEFDQVSVKKQKPVRKKTSFINRLMDFIKNLF